MKKWVAMSLLCLGMCQTVWGEEITDMNHISVVPVNYQGKIFTNGQYTDLSDYGYQVYSQDGSTYLPLRLVEKLISKPEESWDTIWESNKPNQVILRCIYMDVNDAGGASASDKEKLVVKLTVGSTEAKVGKQTVILSKAPTRINGTVVLPLRSIGELLGKTVDYKEGMVILSDAPLPSNQADIKQMLAIVKTELENKAESKAETKVEKLVDQGWAEQITSIEGTCYYEVYYDDEKTAKSCKRLFSQQPGKAAQLIKEVDSNITILFEDSYYYVEQGALYSLNLKNKQTEKVMDKVEGILTNDDSEWMISQFFKQDGTLYFIKHFGDNTTCDEELYSVQNKEATLIAEAHTFGQIIVKDSQIYYIDYNFMNEQGKLYVYDQVTKQSKMIGTEGEVYGVNVELTSDGFTFGGPSNEAFIEGNQLYMLCQNINNPTEGGIYAIQLSDYTKKKVASLSTKFWNIEHRLYYIESGTGYLKVIDLVSGQEKTLIEKAISQAFIRKNVIYYTLKGNDGTGGNGLYSYGFTTGIAAEITNQKIIQFRPGKSGLVYETSGIQPGLYRWDGEKNTALETRKMEQVIIGETGICYSLKDRNGYFVVLY